MQFAFFLSILVFLLAPSPMGAAEFILSPPSTATSERPRFTPEPPFPSIYFTESIKTSVNQDRARPYWVNTELDTAVQDRRIADYQSILLNEDILAFYGSPLSKRMGILGAYPIPELDKILTEWAAAYDEANGERGIRKAFYIIYGTVWPEGEIGILRDSKLIEYIEYAQANNILVFLDHQIGKYGVIESLRKLLPYLRYPNVHLALDPEWRTTKPMVEIGTVSAAELNEAQDVMEKYIIEHGIPGERMLVIHQFNWRMISSREQVRSDFARVRLVHCADGFGPPAMKRSSYAFNALAPNIPVKGFKLFFKSAFPAAGFDEPLIPPKEVFELSPRPYVIMYQ
ncbi:hypothetical protein MASR2M78_23650 [Treponema sp.]